MSAVKQPVSKIEAAEIQLRYAIWLFFSKANTIPIETLTSAASGILRPLGKQYGVTAFLHESDKIEPESKKYWHGKLHENSNFFKHADRDPDKILDYENQSFHFLLLEACDLYLMLIHKDKLNRVAHPAVVVYHFWFGFAHPNLLKEPIHQKQQTFHEKAQKESIGPNDLEYFKNLVLDLEEHQQANTIQL